MKIHVTIEGITPLLMNRFTEAAEAQVSGGHRPSISGDKGTPREQASPKRYADEHGNLYIPGPNVMAPDGLVSRGRGYHPRGGRSPSLHPCTNTHPRLPRGRRNRG